MDVYTDTLIDDDTFHADVDYLEALWQRRPIGTTDLPVIDLGTEQSTGQPLVFVPILEHLEFVYVRQIRALSQQRRVILYRRQEVRARFVGLAQRAEELRRVLDSLGLERVDLLGHGDAAMVLFEFAARYPQRCRSLIIIAQGADYTIAPHPFIWLLHEIFLRFPIEHLLSAVFLRRNVINYITARKQTQQMMAQSSTGASAVTTGVSPSSPKNGVQFTSTRYIPLLPRHLIEEQFRKIALWPFVYKFSVLPIIHYFDMRERLDRLTMPILLINRGDDALSPEAKTRWLADHLPGRVEYVVVPGGERFFMYAQAETVNQLIEHFLESLCPS